ncbi:MAG TPA: hypothetical protein VGC29_00170 [Flavisolibacter sp.]
MLSLFTKYLVQYGNVCIPHIGTFELVSLPPSHDIADHVFTPPFYITKHSRSEKISEHQAFFFAASSHSTRDKVENEISDFGEQLKIRVSRGPFQWNGLGTLRIQSSEILFEPSTIELPSLNPVPAQKVFRENARHQVLVGDREVTSDPQGTSIAKTGEKMPLYLVIGWILFGLAIITIAMLLYLEKFQVSASGLKWNF